MVEEIANSLSEPEKEQLSRKSLYAKSEEWQSIMQDKKPSFFDQPIKMELDKIPSKEVGECVCLFSDSLWLSGVPKLC